MSKFPSQPTAADQLSEATSSEIKRDLQVEQRGTEEIIPIAEEEVRVGKREVITGKVRVRTLVDVVTEPVQASLQEETVEVTRVPIDREISEAPQVCTENGVTIVPVVEEVLVVEKRLVLKEELHIRRHTRTETVEIPVEIRRQRAEVERVSGDDIPSQPKEERSP